MGKSKRYPHSGVVPKSYTIRWQHSRFGWDALLINSRGACVNAINYGLKREPTAADTAKARRVFMGVS